MVRSSSVRAGEDSGGVWEGEGIFGRGKIEGC